MIPANVTKTQMEEDGTVTATIELTEEQKVLMDRSILTGFSIREETA